MSPGRSSSKRNSSSARKNLLRDEVKITKTLTPHDKAKQVQKIVSRSLGILGSATARRRSMKKDTVTKKLRMSMKKITVDTKKSRSKRTEAKEEEKEVEEEREDIEIIEIVEATESTNVPVESEQVSEEYVPLKLTIPVGQCRATVYPNCVINPGIPLTWYDCRKCSRIFPTASERDTHKAEHKKGKRRKVSKNKTKIPDTQDADLTESSDKTKTLPGSASDSSTVTSNNNNNNNNNNKPISQKGDDDGPPVKKSRNRDIDESPSAPRIPCDCCSETFSTRKDLKKHKILQSNNKHEKTISLGISPKSSQTIEFGPRNGMGLRSTKQRVLDQDFGFRDTLKRHVRIHEDSQDQINIDQNNLVSPRSRESRKQLSSQRATNKAGANAKKLSRRNMIYHSHLESLSPEQII